MTRVINDKLFNFCTISRFNKLQTGDLKSESDLHMYLRQTDNQEMIES